MRFFLKRYVHAFSAHRRLLLLFLIPLFVYLLLSATIPDRFSVEQEIAIPKNALVRVGKRPGSTLPMSEMILRPESFFQDDFALLLLEKRLNPDTFLGPAKTPLSDLKATVETGMTLTMTGGKRVAVAYHGNDRDLGEKLVGFYSQRLVNKLKTGSSPASKIGNRKKKPSASLIGQTGINEFRALWRTQRLYPSLVIAVISVLIILIIIALIEWLDPSFKSERQVARYLGIPILGSLPNLKKISDAIALHEKRPHGN